MRLAARTAALVCPLALLVPGGSVVAAADPNDSSSGATDSPGASDTALARAQAEEQGKRVGITSKRTEGSTTWADPHGTLTTEVFQEPIRVRQGGSWTPVDTTLADTGAAVTPGATVADLNLSDGGAGPFAKVADDGTSLAQSPGRGSPVTHHYEVRARGYYGGAKTSTAYIPTAKHCAYCQKDTEFTPTTPRAITWTDGASLADVIGIDSSAETGYSSDATVDYIFNANRYFCGTGGAPGGSHPYNFVATTTKSGHTR
ncbi:hypothetical protein [Streptomyces sp. NPDC058457]|uniref:hypothetical protein n=1 Tax=Streptomyces sp. NPDC058457 TaxID=3346507 RepID=UPI00365ED488